MEEVGCFKGRSALRQGLGAFRHIVILGFLCL